MALFKRYIGIDYSGAKTSESSLSGLRVYVADSSNPVHGVEPPASPRTYCTRRGVAEWLCEKLAEDVPTVAGIDHGFSFPVAYFNKYSLPLEWPTFLDDFQQHWPTNAPPRNVPDVRAGRIHDEVLGKDAPAENLHKSFTNKTHQLAFFPIKSNKRIQLSSLKCLYLAHKKEQQIRLRIDCSTN